jgi:hypothetical protein
VRGKDIWGGLIFIIPLFYCIIININESNGGKGMKGKSLAVPNEMQEKYNEITEIIKKFCEENLNEEYEHVCSQLNAALCRKRPSPLVKGKANTWACGIVHAVGTVNFLFDISQNPTMKAKELYNQFGVSESNGSSKSKQIRDLMKIGVFDPKWTLPSKISNNPMAWMITVNGLTIDSRYAPREIQEEAFKRGLIPYLQNKK